MTFYFTAPLTYNSNYVQKNVNEQQYQIASTLYTISSSGYQRLLLRPYLTRDPVTKAGFTVHFWTRTAPLTVNYINTYNNCTMNSIKSTNTIGRAYNVTYPSSFVRPGANHLTHNFKYKYWKSPTGDKLSENMPGRAAIINIYYDPWQNAMATYKNIFPNYDDLGGHTDSVKVVSSYSFNAPPTMDM